MLREEASVLCLSVFVANKLCSCWLEVRLIPWLWALGRRSGYVFLAVALEVRLYSRCDDYV